MFLIVKWRWSAKLPAASSELPEFLSKGRRRDPVQGEFPVLAPVRHHCIFASRGPNPRCVRERGEGWLSFIDCSNDGMPEQSSSKYDFEKEK